MSMNGLYSGKPKNNSADRLAASATLQLAKEENRPSFELFKRNTCHMLKDLGDISFLVQLLKSNQIRTYYEKKWYPEALYLLAMLDYLSRLNNVPTCKNYNDIRIAKLECPLYPSSVLLLCKIQRSEAPKQESLRTAIPEFLRFNIIENDVRNIF